MNEKRQYTAQSQAWWAIYGASTYHFFAEWYMLGNGQKFMGVYVRKNGVLVHEFTGVY